MINNWEDAEWKDPSKKSGVENEKSEGVQGAAGGAAEAAADPSGGASLNLDPEMAKPQSTEQRPKHEKGSGYHPGPLYIPSADPNQPSTIWHQLVQGTLPGCPQGPARGPPKTKLAQAASSIVVNPSTQSIINQFQTLSPSQQDKFMMNTIIQLQSMQQEKEINDRVLKNMSEVTKFVPISMTTLDTVKLDRV